MRLDGLGFLAHRSAQVALGGDGIALPQIERGEDDQGLGLTRQILADLFQAGDDAVDLLRGSCHARQEEERLEVLGISLQNGLGLVPRLVGLGAEQIDRAELLSYLEVVRSELLDAEQVPVGLTHLAGLVVGEAELANGVSVVLLDAKGVAVLEGGLAILLQLEVPISALEVASLLGLRRTGTSRDQDKSDQQQYRKFSRTKHDFCPLVNGSQSGRYSPRIG